MLSPALLLLFWMTLYFLPTLVAWRRRRQIPHFVGRPLILIFAINLLTGWTIVGWLAAMLLGTSDLLPTTSTTSQNSPTNVWEPQEKAERPKCTGCNWGRAPCPRCHGQGALVDCTYCVRSGTVECTSCGGSGYSPY
jgi:hypothetical protein